MDKKKILEQLSIYDKASLLVGYTNMTTKSFNDVGVTSLVMSDGPNGLRKESNNQTSIEGVMKTLPATCFPCGSALAQSFDDELLEKVGKQIAIECRYFGVNALLGPAINIKRNPLCGRNFEYYSEDPYLSGHIASSFINGVQSQKVIACVKHYACNNLEKWRYTGDSIVDRRALNEIYLKSFEIAIKESNPGMVMTAYNQINGTFASENKYLLKDTLLGKWNYKCLTVTDWGGMVHRDISLNMGQDLEMPGMVEENIEKIVKGIKSKLISEETLDNSVSNLLDAIEKTKAERIKDESIFDQSEEVAYEAAVKSAVLLKNENNILPLDKHKKIAIVGDLFGFLRFQGSGSALINAKRVVENTEAFDEEGIDYVYARGYDSIKSQVNPKLESEALKACKDIKTILFFGGLTDLSESEGYDREDMRLEKNQNHLLKELSKLEDKTIICVFYGGAAFEIPCYDKIDAILYMNLPGQMGGKALVDLLYGKVSPSGRLATTWPIAYKDIPFSDEFASSPLELYKESIFVGYRYFSTVKKEVRFPFGYGLSYGQTEFSNFKVKKGTSEIKVSLDVKNLSDIELEETVQIYVGAPHSMVARPVKELKKYAKVKLAPKETKQVTLDVLLKDLEIYDSFMDKFILEQGDYIIYVSKNVNDDLYKEMVELKGEYVYSRMDSKKYWDVENLEKITREDFEHYLGRHIPKYVPSKKPYTMETPICEMRSLFSNIIKHQMAKEGIKIIKSAKNAKTEKEKQRLIKSGVFVKKMIFQNCLRSLLFSSGGILTTEKAEGILDIANGKLFKGLKKVK